MEKIHAHRPGALKQTNKAHKHGRHKSKGARNLAAGGKVDIKTITKRKPKELSRPQRRNQAVQIRQRKRNEVLAKKRSLGTLDSSPFLVCVVPLQKEFDPMSAVSILTQCDPEAVVNKSPSGVIHIIIPRFKQHFALIVPSSKNELFILDTMKICHTVLFLVSATGGISFGTEAVDEWGNNILLSSFAQGLPTPVIAVTDLESISPKKRHDQKQSIQKIISKWFPEEKLMKLDTNVDGLNILRKIGNQKLKTILYRDRRPHIYADNVEYVKNTEGAEGTLKVTGYLQGTRLSVNGLMYLLGLGTFQLSQIDAPYDPYYFIKKGNSDNGTMEQTQVVRVLERADAAKQHSLDSENIPDLLAAEQTWPTEEEIKMAQGETIAKKIKRVPKGWSDYQAAWIPDEDAEMVSSQSDYSEDESNYMEAESEEKSEYSDAEEEDMMTYSEMEENGQQYDQQMDIGMEQTDLEKIKAARSDRMFPDEIDTPQDLTARVRFQKYRGLESFRTSPWDPKENLPSNYARIFQFANFDHTKKRILKESDEESEGALHGWYITVHVKNVSELLWKSFQETGAPLVLMGLLPHENKMSVLNVVLKRTNISDTPVKSKERLIFQCGYRRFIVNPIFSQHTNGTKHKFERFFQPDSTAVATFFAPIQFPPSPVLCFKEIDNALTLIATGSLLSCNPDRIVVKRIVLSGHPLKVHKRSAVVRFMFFNPEDVAYFKPCKLRTKHGRIGHIKEPLGTHGHMKCVFNGQLKSQDTVLLNLYKRIYPKWTYEECIVSCIPDDKIEL